MEFYIAFSAFVFLQVMDMISTYLFMSKGLHEGNPLLRCIFKKFGFWSGGLTTKLVAISVSYTQDTIVLEIWNFIFVIIVIWNLYVYSHHEYYYAKQCAAE